MQVASWDNPAGAKMRPKRATKIKRSVSWWFMAECSVVRGETIQGERVIIIQIGHACTEARESIQHIP